MPGKKGANTKIKHLDKQRDEIKRLMSMNMPYSQIVISLADRIQVSSKTLIRYIKTQPDLLEIYNRNKTKRKLNIKDERSTC